MSREYTRASKAVAVDDYIFKDNEPEPIIDDSSGYILYNDCMVVVVNQIGARCPYCGDINKDSDA